MTIATYWSPAMMFSPMHVATTDAIRRPVDVARARIGRMRRSRKPASSMIAAKLRAPRTSQIVMSIESIPPRENSASIVALPVSRRSRWPGGVDRLDRRVQGPWSGPVDERGDGGGLGEAGQHAGEQGAAEDRQERRHPPEREDDEQRQRQQVERRDPELLRELRLGDRRVEGGARRRCRQAKDGEHATAMSTAGPDVQIIAPMCCWVVTPPTIDGTRTVVSEIGVILSPK